MTRNLIARAPEAEALLRPNGSPHLGLVFDRFPCLVDRGTLTLDTNARGEWLEEFLEIAHMETPTRKNRLQSVHDRLDALTRARNGERREFRSLWRFATGLGNPNAADIGFAFDAACGVPYLAGSAVKGLARAGAVLCGADAASKSALLGDGPGGREEEGGCVGGLVFLDALPSKWLSFEIDVITRHHDAEGLATQRTPLSADEPKPVPFLTLAPGTVFVFRLLPAPGVAPESLATAWEWLAAAVELGAGAKTAVGYGWMVEETSTR